MQYVNYTLKIFLSDKRIFVSFLVIAFGFLLFSPIYANAATYYFNNAVNTDPAEVGNYWNDSGATDPALGLPNFATDEVNILSGSTFDNDGTIYEPIAFNDSAVNDGTVTGDAIFYNNSSINNGTVSGTKTRYFNVDTSTGSDYVTDGPWTIVADGLNVNVVSATVDSNTIFSSVNSGTFTYITLSSYRANGSYIYLTYGTALDTESVPATSVYAVTVDGVSTSVSSVGVSGNIVTLTFASTFNFDDVISLSYTTPGTNPIQRSSLGSDAPSFSNLSIPFNVNTGTGPRYATLVGNKLYVVNADSDTVSVINTTTDTVSATISVGSGPTYITSFGTKVYVNNSIGDTVSVINTTTDTVSATISVGDNPYYIYTVGNKVYTNNAIGNSISVINTTTDTVSTTISSIGNFPYYSTIVGSKLYVSNNGGASVSVIDLTTNTKTTTINVGTNPNFLVSAGNKVYVANLMSDTVSVINTTTDTVSSTVSVGDGPYYLNVVGTKVYVNNTSSGTVSVINTTTDTVSSTISVGSGPQHSTIFGNELYVVNMNANTVSVVNTSSGSVVSTVSTRTTPIFSYIVNDKLYVLNNGSNNVNVINTNSITSKLPELTSFSSSTASGTYVSGQDINITANFGRNLLAGSTMTVTLNTGDSVVLSSVSGSTLSGTYTIGSGDTTPDLAVTAVTSASVTDSTNTYTRTSYSLPSSVGSFTGENSFITRNIGDSKNIVIGSILTVSTGDNPYQISAKVTINSVDYVYVANQGDDTVSVIRLSDNTVTDTISVGSEPYGLTVVTISSVAYIYVANILSNNVSVIDTSTNTVVATISVGVKPYYATAINTNVYITNGGSNTVSVINANTNTVSATIPVGSYPRGIKAYGTDLYVANYGDMNYSGGNYISVIDSTLNEVTDYIISPAGTYGPRGVTVLGTKVYVANYRSNTVSVINTATNAITDTISVGAGPRGIVGIGTDIYVENFDDGTISVIDTNTNTVTDTIVVGHSPSGMSVVGTDIYISSFQDNKLYVLDTTDNTLDPAISSPTVVTSSASSVTNSSVTLNGSISSTGGENATITGFDYGLTASYGSTVSHNGSFSTGAFTESLNMLVCNTTYHFRAFATNSSGTGVGSDDTFTTWACSGGGSVTPITPPKPIEIFTPSTNCNRPICFNPPGIQFKQSSFYNTKNDEVRYLQKFLNNNGFVLAKSGLGSPGNETDYFGILTKKALISFQEKHAKDILTPVGLKKGTGFFGPSTRKFINNL